MWYHSYSKVTRTHTHNVSQDFSMTNIMTSTSAKWLSISVTSTASIVCAIFASSSQNVPFSLLMSVSLTICFSLAPTKKKFRQILPGSLINSFLPNLQMEPTTKKTLLPTIELHKIVPVYYTPTMLPKHPSGRQIHTNSSTSARSGQ